MGSLCLDRSVLGPPGGASWSCAPRISTPGGQKHTQCPLHGLLPQPGRKPKGALGASPSALHPQS